MQATINLLPALGGALALSLLSPADLRAQAITYPDFTRSQGLELNGSALVLGDRIVMTTSQQTLASSVWHERRHDVLGGFDTTFEFLVEPGPGPNSEGLVFVVHNDLRGSAALAGGGAGIGYGAQPPLHNALAIEIDTLQDSGDISDNEISVQTLGSMPTSSDSTASIGRFTPSVDLDDGQPHAVRVRYASGRIFVYVDDLTTPALVVPWTFEQGGNSIETLQPTGGMALPEGRCWAGFTSASRRLGRVAHLLSWTFESTPTVHPCYEGEVRLRNGEPLEVLYVDGSLGMPNRYVTKFAGRGTRLEVRIRTALPVFTPVILFATLGAANGSAVVPSPYGTLCFLPLTPIIQAPAITPIRLDLPPLPPVGPITFQGLLGLDTNATEIRTTNAIVVDWTR